MIFSFSSDFSILPKTCLNLIYFYIFLGFIGILENCTKLGRFWSIFVKIYIFCPFCLSSPSETPIAHFLEYLMLSHMPLRLWSFSSHHFSLFFDWIISTDMSSSSLTFALALFNLLLNPSNDLFPLLLYTLQFHNFHLVTLYSFYFSAKIPYIIIYYVNICLYVLDHIYSRF